MPIPSKCHRIYVYVESDEVIFVMNKTMTELERVAILESLPDARVYEGKYGHVCYTIKRPYAHVKRSA